MSDTVMTVLGIFFLAGAFLAYKWNYSYHPYAKARRDNQQLALVTVLITTGLVALGIGRDVF